MCKVKKGSRLEQHVIASFKQVGVDAHKTVKRFGDVVAEEFLVECKNYNTRSISVSYPHWTKIATKARSLNKVPIYVRQNSEGEVFATLQLCDFLSLVRRVYERRQGEQDGGSESFGKQIQRQSFPKRSWSSRGFRQGH